MAGACFLFDYAVKSIKFLFKPNYANELQIAYSRYGPINSTKRLSKRMIKKLSGNKKKQINVVENNTRKESKRATRARESGIVQRIKRRSHHFCIRWNKQAKK